MNLEQKGLYALKTHVLISLIWGLPLLLFFLFLGDFNETLFPFFLPTFLFILLGTWASWITFNAAKPTRIPLMSINTIIFWGVAVISFFAGGVLFGKGFALLFGIYGLLSMLIGYFVFSLYQKKDLLH